MTTDRTPADPSATAWSRRRYALRWGFRWASYPLRKRRWLAALRVLWSAYVLGHMGESCDLCGRDMDYSWWAPTPLWQALVSQSGYGCVCLRCFDRLAEQAGWVIRWSPIVNGRRENGIHTPTTNWLHDDTREALLMGRPDPGAFDRPPGEDGRMPQQEPWAAIRELTGLPDAPVGGYGR